MKPNGRRGPDLAVLLLASLTALLGAGGLACRAQRGDRDFVFLVPEAAKLQQVLEQLNP